MKKILIVEDEIKIYELIKDTLELVQYETDYASDGMMALNKIEKNKYDLILLDIMMPKLDGFEVLKEIETTNTPIIFLSARTDVESIVKGLKGGAQDYITKPFEPLELLARIALRLGEQKKKQEKFTYQDITVHVLERKVYQKGNREIELAPKEFDLLILLLENQGIALTRNEMLNQVWGIDVEIETRTIDYHIQQLRKKLHLKHEIVTINRIGYRLEKEYEI